MIRYSTGVEYSKGTKFKTNGHTRDICWASGVCKDGQPSHLKVNWRSVDSIHEVREEYLVFDSSNDAENIPMIKSMVHIETHFLIRVNL